jgi:hypothetical protein
MATTRKKTLPADRPDDAAAQAASRTAGRTSSARTAVSREEPGAPTPERVSERAFEIWQKAGRPDGHALDHWLQAETELRQK